MTPALTWCPYHVVATTRVPSQVEAWLAISPLAVPTFWTRRGAEQWRSRKQYEMAALADQGHDLPRIDLRVIDSRPCARCTHMRETHLHYRVGSDCGSCACEAFAWWRG